MGRRRIVVIGVAALAVVGLVAVLAVGTGAPAARAGGNPVTADAPGATRILTGRAYLEYLVAQHALGALPRGASWPVGVPAQAGYGAVGGGLLRPDSGTDTAYFTYLCAWESEAIDAFDSEQRGRTARASRRIGSFFETAWALRISRDGVWAAGVYLPTQSGNYAGMRFDLRGSCRRAGIQLPESLLPLRP